MQIRSKLTISTFVAVLFMLALGSTSYILIHRLADITRQVADTQETVVHLVGIKSRIQNAYKLTELHIKFEDGVSMGLIAEEMDQLKEVLDEDFNGDDGLLASHPGNIQIKELFKSWVRFDQTRIKVIGLSDLFSSQAAEELLEMHGLPNYANCILLLENQLDHYRSTAQKLRKRSQTAKLVSEILIASSTLIVILLVVFGGLVITRSITNPLLKLADYMKSHSLAEDSEFKADAKKNNDEMQTLIRSLEIQVQNRTEALLQSNQLLEKEIEVRKEKENEVKKSERKYRRIFNNTTAWMAYTSIEGDFLETNISLMEQLGYPDEELKEMNLKDLIRESDYSQLDEFFETLRTKGKASGIMMLLGKNGNRYVLDYQSNIINAEDSAGETLAVHFAKDITRQKDAENAFQESELRFQSLVNALPLAYFITDSNRALIFANRKTSETFPGLSKDPRPILPGENSFSDLLIPEDRLRANLDMEESLETRNANWHLYTCQRKDGSLFPCEILTTPLNQGSGQERLQHILVDVSERLEKEELKKQKEIAEKTNSAISEWLAFVAHEIRNPLSGIIGFARLGVTKADKISPDKAHNYFGQIHTAGNRLEVLLNDLLDLSKMEIGHLTLERNRSDLTRIIFESQQQYEALLQEKGLTLTVNPLSTVDTPLSVICDEFRIGQVLRNLLSNAIKFTPPGRQIRITVEDTTLPGRRALDETIGAIQVNIVDEGIGIPEDQLDLVFNKYKQSRKTKTGEGTGLGLPICRQIIKAHGGTIWVDSVENEGSTFSFTLPLGA